jgi:hypothetical protein
MKRKTNKSEKNFMVMVTWTTEKDAKQLARMCPSAAVHVREGGEIFTERADVIWDLEKI